MWDAVIDWAATWLGPLNMLATAVATYLVVSRRWGILGRDAERIEAQWRRDAQLRELQLRADCIGHKVAQAEAELKEWQQHAVACTDRQAHPQAPPPDRAISLTGQIGGTR